jgi:hypothetical protein
MALRLEPLNRSHRPLLADFRNPRASLVEYLTRYALRHAEKDLLARTYVALDAGVGLDHLGADNICLDRAAALARAERMLPNLMGGGEEDY